MHCCLCPLLLFTLSMTSIASRELFSFGIMIHHDQFLQTNLHTKVYLQLNWGTYSFHCNASIYNGSMYLCYVNDIITTQCDYTNYVSPNGRYSLTISNINLNDSLIIDQILVNMNDNSYYTIESFCIADEYNQSAITGYNQIYSTNCTDFNSESEYENVIINASVSYQLVTIYFIENVTFWVNSNEAGLIQNNNRYNTQNNIMTHNCHNIPILSFGFTIADYHISAPHDDTIQLTLYWFDNIFACNISKPTSATESRGETFMCAQNDIMLIESNNLNYEYKMKLNYEHTNVVYISEIVIIDFFGNSYNINFCGPSQYQYWTGERLWEKLHCPDELHSHMYKYQSIKMDTDHIFIKMLYIEFKHILSYPQTNSFGIISPAKIVQYGIRTVTVPQSTIYLRLYWNTYLYLCTLDITTENELYLCDITYCIEPTQQSNYEYHFALTITMDNKNSFEIDHVFVKDESGYEYDIYRFCQQLQSETPNSLAKCNQFDNLYQYSSVRICYDDVECKTNSLLALIFPNKLFDRDHRDPNANNDKESMILYYPQYVLNDQLLCENNWTLFPTISPNYLPTQLLTNVPTISTSNVINNTTQKPGEDSDSMMQQIQPYIVFGAVLLTIILCATVIGCCFYVKSLHKKLNHKSPSMQSQNHNDNNRDMDTSNRYG
eukprot:499790_1